MNKKTTAIILAAIAILAIIGVIVAINMNSSSDNDTNNQSGQPSDNNTSRTVDPSQEFNPQTLEGLSYVATSTTTVDGQVMKSVTESDGKGKIKTSSSIEGIDSESYVDGDTVITCINGECTKSTVDASAEEQATATQDMDQYRKSAQYAGTEACSTGTCQVWKANGPVGEVTYYIDEQNRIAKVSMGAGGTETTYDYKDVSITIPTV